MKLKRTRVNDSVYYNKETGVWTPNEGGQADFIADWKNRIVALEGGWGSGKTSAGALKLITLHCFNGLHRLPTGERIATGVPSAIIGLDLRNIKTYDLPAIEEHCYARNLRIVIKLADGEILFPDFSTKRNKSIIYMRTQEEPKRITGWEVGAIWADEAGRFSRDDFDPKNDPLLQARGRLRHRSAKFRQMMLTYTNEGDTTRVYEMTHSGTDGIALYRASTRENIEHVGEEYINDLMTLPKEYQRQYIDGDAITLRGTAVYPRFSESKNLRPLDLDTSLPLRFSVDFNVSPGMHGEIMQYIPAEDRFVICDEVYEDNLDIPGMASMFMSKIVRFGIKEKFPFPELILHGDAASGRSRTTFDSGMTQFDYLVRFIREYIGVHPKLEVPMSNPPPVNRFIAVNCAMCEADGTVHCLVNPRCKKLIDDLRKLRYDKKGRIVDESNRLKHASDAAGYCIHWVRPVRERIPERPGQFNVVV